MSIWASLTARFDRLETSSSSDSESLCELTALDVLACERASHLLHGLSSDSCQPASLTMMLTTVHRGGLLMKEHRGEGSHLLHGQGGDSGLADGGLGGKVRGQ